jgi:hypothetical protein
MQVYIEILGEVMQSDPLEVSSYMRIKLSKFSDSTMFNKSRTYKLLTVKFLNGLINYW